MCIRVSARTTLVLVAFSTENFVLPFCKAQSQHQALPAIMGYLHRTAPPRMKPKLGCQCLRTFIRGCLNHELFFAAAQPSFLKRCSAHLAGDAAYTPGQMLAAERLHDTTASVTAEAGLQAAARWLDRCVTRAYTSHTGINLTSLAICSG